MSGLGVVLLKECRDNLRDRRTIVSSLALAVLGPALFAALMTLVLNTTLGESRQPFELAVAGAEHAPGLVAHLERQNVTVLRLTDTTTDAAEPPQAPRELVERGVHDLVLAIDPDYGARFAAGEINSLALFYDSSGMGTTRRNALLTRQYVQAYAQTIGALRLQLRGIDPRILAPVVVEEIDTASPAARALSLLATLPYLLVLVIFMGGFYLAIDATAGEREHGTLEPLLSQPISRLQLVLGKIAAAALFSALALALFLASLTLSLPWVPLHKVGMSLALGPGDAALMFLLCLPLVLFAAALLTVVASFARTYKEGQTYLTGVILIPTLPLIVTQLTNLEPDAWLMLVPSLGQAELITGVIRGEPAHWSHVVASILGTTTLAALLAAIAVRMYQRERILV
jgi:sodium transport system permease protein